MCIRDRNLIRLLDLKVNRISFVLNEKYDSTDAINIDAVSNVQVSDIDKETGEFLVGLSVKLFDGNDNPPFNIEMEIEGLFSVDLSQNQDTIEQLSRLNTVAILLPYLRALVAQIPSIADVATVNPVSYTHLYNSPDVMQALVQEGLASNPDTSADGQAQRLAGKLDAGKNASNFEAGSLAQANEAAISAEARANAVLDKAGVQRAYDPNETVKLKDCLLYTSRCV